MRRFTTETSTAAHGVRDQLNLEKAADLFGRSAPYVTQRMMLRAIGRTRAN